VWPGAARGSLYPTHYEIVETLTELIL